MVHTPRVAFRARLAPIIAACGVLLVGLSACQVSQLRLPFAPATAVPAFSFIAHDHTFEGPSQLPAGLVSVSLHNAGQAQHHLQLIELNQGVTIEQLTAAFQQGPDAAATLVKGTAGGPATIAPGETQQVTLELSAGQYALFCLIPDQQGVPHLVSGMVAPLTVTEAEPANQGEPVAAQTVTMHDHAYRLLDRIVAGPQTWKIVNVGQQPHEIRLIKLAAGKTFEDVVAYYATPDGEAPYQAVGGLQALDHDETGWVQLDLEPGIYVAYCYVRDPASGKSHVQLGMAQPFTVHP